MLLLSHTFRARTRRRTSHSHTNEHLPQDPSVSVFCIGQGYLPCFPHYYPYPNRRRRVERLIHDVNGQSGRLDSILPTGLTSLQRYFEHLCANLGFSKIVEVVSGLVGSAVSLDQARSPLCRDCEDGKLQEGADALGVLFDVLEEEGLG